MEEILYLVSTLLITVTTVETRLTTTPLMMWSLFIPRLEENLSQSTLN